jgi:hypothetical protein
VIVERQYHKQKLPLLRQRVERKRLTLLGRGHGSQTPILMGGTGCSLLLRSSRAVGVSLAQQYLGE